MKYYDGANWTEGNLATPTSDGLMPQTDKELLDGVQMFGWQWLTQSPSSAAGRSNLGLNEAGSRAAQGTPGELELGTASGNRVWSPRILVDYITSKVNASKTVVNVKDYGAKGDGVTDDTTAIKSALVGGAGKSIYFPAGRYKIMEDLLVPNNTQVSGAGSNVTIFDWSSKDSFSSGSYNSLIQWEKGTAGSSVSVSVDLFERDVSVDLGSSASQYKAGDIIRISSDDISYAEATRAEFQRILQIDGTVATLSTGIFDNYTSANNIKVEKMSFSSGGINGITLVGKGYNPSGYADNAIQIFFTENFIVDDVQFRNIEHRCIMVNSCIGTKVINSNFVFDTRPIALQYGVGINGASQMTVVHNCSSYNDRHMVTTNSSTSTASSATYSRGIPRVMTVSSCTSTGSWQAPIDTHRAGEYATIIGNTLSTESTGIKVRSKNALVTGNTIVGKLVSVTGAATGIRIGMVCENVQIVGNFIKNFGNGVHLDTPDGDTKTINLVDNTIIDCNYPINLSNSAVTLTDVNIMNNYLRALNTTTPIKYPINITAITKELTIQGNVISGGNDGIFVASGTHTDMIVKDNKFKDQVRYAFYLRNITNGLVTGNYSPKPYRFAESTSNIYYGWNFGTLSDVSTSGGVKSATWS